MVEWTQNTCLNLLKEVRARSLLWDTKDPSYRNFEKKEAAWQEISQILGIDNVEETKKKLESLKGSFRRERCRKKRLVRKGLTYESRWFAYEAMKFLESAKGEAKESVQFVAINSDDSPQEKDNEDEENSSSKEPQSEPEAEPPPKRRSPRKRSTKRVEEEALASEYPVTIRPSEGLQEVEAELVTGAVKDECATFGDFVAMKLRKLDSRLRAIAQHKISSIMYESEMSLYHGNVNNYRKDTE